MVENDAIKLMQILINLTKTGYLFVNINNNKLKLTIFYLFIYFFYN
jgi:hypothetical protein